MAILNELALGTMMLGLVMIERVVQGLEML
jgi:hypothetical protein